MIQNGVPSSRRGLAGEPDLANLLIPLLLAGMCAQGAIAQETDPGGLGLAGPNSVESTLATTAARQKERGSRSWSAFKTGLAKDTGLSFGIDAQVQYFSADRSSSPSEAFGGVVRLYGTWDLVGRGTTNTGQLVFKIENRTSLGNKVDPQIFGPMIGYAGLMSSTFSDAGSILSNLYWRQYLADGRLGFVIGQVDVTDYVDVSSLASPWTAFSNLAFETNPTIPAPSQGLGLAVQWRFAEEWLVLAGIADANGDPADPVDSAENLFDTGETFRHLAVAWTPRWGDRYDDHVQLTYWEVDDREAAGVDGGWGAALTASMKRDAWRPFFRAGYADGGGAFLERSVSIGTGYDAFGGRDLFGVGLNWGQAEGIDRDQYTAEAFYRYDPLPFLQITPSLQYIANPANDPTTDDIVVFGLRARVAF